ncbi:PACSIN3 [Bugula neritina]|uniref:PACSIN3 n=1 Tax=Bugula neritina TaxID=10212 RepID=A0A7J7JRF1_BUGNE|nr:PACSIN3 [Bugula neritina]
MASGSYFNFVIPCDKYLPIPENKTFWDEGQYDPTVKRLENGKRSLDDFLLMVGERAAIERRYADKLQSWYKKWSVAVKQVAWMYTTPGHQFSKDRLKASYRWVIIPST